MSQTTRMSICVCHDDPVVMQTLLEFLADLGHAAAPARSHDELRDRLESTSAKTDVVISRLAMYELEGIELLQQAHRQHPEVEVLLITNGGRGLSAAEAASCGVYAFVREPLWLSEVELYLTRLRA